MYLTHVQIVVLDWSLYCECVCPSVRPSVSRCCYSYFVFPSSETMSFEENTH